MKATEAIIEAINGKEVMHSSGVALRFNGEVFLRKEPYNDDFEIYDINKLGMRNENWMIKNEPSVGTTIEKMREQTENNINKIVSDIEGVLIQSIKADSKAGRFYSTVTLRESIFYSLQFKKVKKKIKKNGYKTKKEKLKKSPGWILYKVSWEVK